MVMSLVVISVVVAVGCDFLLVVTVDSGGAFGGDREDCGCFKLN